ncbi:MAG: esterase-like activity of phytase family protein [Pirellula sp.]|nr:esterase-like activity of phytase family protein [Pirellula sp.]
MALQYLLQSSLRACLFFAWGASSLCYADTPIVSDANRSTVAVELIAVGRLPGDSMDLTGLTGTLETGTPEDQLGGFSAIEYSGSGDRYFVLSDRGPGDGAASFSCRLHEFDLALDFQNKSLRPTLIRSVLLKSANGESLSGSLTAVSLKPGAKESLALDSEGLRLFDDKTWIISDEYGPAIHLFGRDGVRTERWELPSSFRLCASPDMPNAIGTYPNRGMEGLAISSDRSKFIGAMQGPLVQDGIVEGDKCLGLYTRWLVMNRETAGRDKSHAQWVYPLTDESTGVSEVLAVDAERYLVLERDSRSGVDAKFKRIYLADTKGATDVTQVSRLGRTELPSGVRTITKTLLIDLLDERFGLGGEKVAEKPEGLCWGPTLADGRRLLLVCVDNDFETERQSEFYAFAIRF